MNKPRGEYKKVKKDKFVGVRMTVEEKEKLQRLAKQAKMNQSEYVCFLIDEIR